MYICGIIQTQIYLGRNKEMSSNIQVARNSDTPAFAGNSRFLLGLLLIIVGFYIGLFSDFQGHAFGFFLVLISPLIIFKDDDSFYEKNLSSKNDNDK